MTHTIPNMTHTMQPPPPKPLPQRGEYLVLKAINYELCALDDQGRWCCNLMQGYTWTYEDGMALVRLHRCLLVKGHPLQAQLRLPEYIA